MPIVFGPFAERTLLVACLPRFICKAVNELHVKLACRARARLEAGRAGPCLTVTAPCAPTARQQGSASSFFLSVLWTRKVVAEAWPLQLQTT